MSSRDAFSKYQRWVKVPGHPAYIVNNYGSIRIEEGSQIVDYTVVKGVELFEFRTDGKSEVLSREDLVAKCFPEGDVTPGH